MSRPKKQPKPGWEDALREAAGAQDAVRDAEAHLRRCVHARNLAVRAAVELDVTQAGIGRLFGVTAERVRRMAEEAIPSG